MSQWWRRLFLALPRSKKRAPPSPPSPFTVTCRCGQPRGGWRQARHQVLACEGCGRKLFVLPQSPWPPLEQELAQPAPAPPLAAFAASAVPKRARAWFLPVLAATASLLIVAGLVAGLWFWFLDTDPPLSDSQVRMIRERVAEGRQALKQGEFSRANAELQQAQQRLRQLPPQALPSTEAREIGDLCRQTELLAQLLSVPLEQILAQAHRPPPDVPDWPTHFRQTYAGKAVVLEAPIHADRLGDRVVYTVEYPLQVEGILARLDLTDLPLQGQLPDHGSPRILFGARLASLRLEQVGEKVGHEWVFRFQPESLVFFTAPEVAEAWGLADDKEARGRLDPASDWVRMVWDYPIPDQVSRQLLVSRSVEQWIYGKNPPSFIVRVQRSRAASP